MDPQKADSEMWVGEYAILPCIALQIVVVCSFNAYVNQTLLLGDKVATVCCTLYVCAPYDHSLTLANGCVCILC